MTMNYEGLMLLSGGLDSYILGKNLENKEILAITFDWNQFNGEVKMARKQAEKLGFDHKVLEIPEMDKKGEVPFRNLILLSNSLRVAKNNDIHQVYLAVHKANPRWGEGGTYFDCSEKFIDLMNKISQRGGIKITAPFVEGDGIDILLENSDIEIPEYVRVCNRKTENHCGQCGKCMDTLGGIYVSSVKHNLEFERTPFSQQTTNLMKKFPLWFEARYYHNDVCNLDCDFCYYGWDEREYEPTPEMKTDIIDSIHKLGINRIMFSGREPLYDREVFRLIRHFGDNYGGKSSVNTNGINVQKYMSDIYAHSFHGLEKMLLSFHKGIYENVSYLTEIEDLNVQPYLVVDKDNKNDIPEKIEELTEVGAKNFYVRPMMPRGKSGSKLKNKKLDLEEEFSVLRNICFRNENITVDFPIQHPPKKVDWLDIDWKNFHFTEKIDGCKVNYKFLHDRCLAYWLSITVLPNGDVVGCAKHTYEPREGMEKKYVIGNVLEDSSKSLRRRMKKSIGGCEYCLK